MKKLFLYLVAFSLILGFRLQHKGFFASEILGDLLFTFILSLPVLLIVLGWHFQQQERLKLAKYKRESNMNLQQRMENLPQTLVYKEADKSFWVSSIFCLFIFQLVNLSNLLIIAANGGNIRVFAFGCLLSSLLFLAWMIIYGFKGSQVQIDANLLKVESLNFFLQKTNLELKTEQISSFLKFKLKSYYRGQSFHFYRLGFLNQQNQLVFLPSQVSASELKGEKFMTEIALLKAKNNLSYLVREDWETKMSGQKRELWQKVGQIVSLILAYFLFPLLILQLFSWLNISF